MQTKILLATLAATATASILPRQTSSGGISKACESDLAEIGDKPIPTPPSALATALPTNVEEICDFKPTGSVSSAYSSYTEEVMSWAKDNEDLFKRITKDCSGGNDFQIPDFSVCQKSGDNDDKNDKDADKADKDGAGVANAPTAMGALLAAGMAVVAAL